MLTLETAAAMAKSHSLPLKSTSWEGLVTLALSYTFVATLLVATVK